jgi:putative Holliday junction resolvase
MMQRGRRIAFDFGDVRIGVAACDSDAILSSPLTTLKSSEKNLSKQLLEIFAEIEPIMIYVGRPALLSGSDGVASEKAFAFVELLQTLTVTPIEMIDERMSTISAARNLRDAGRTAKDSKDSIDMASAVAILDFALEIERRK